ncbi:RNA BINDING PROTEIN [Salix purpurea]|uniref:RNA BINDING PROTEIN n=1 Tax=Salix purpurea TaxID=77065 RepID=A0A9Q0UK85_SALPP|nr:RNA BINDING PROTEIN [Salix purpurea]
MGTIIREIVIGHYHDIDFVQVSGSSVRRRDEDRIYNSDFDNSGGLSRIRDFSNRKYHGRFQESSPSYARGRGGGRPLGRGFDEPVFVLDIIEGEGMRKKYPNVRPREGDWICTDPLCGNLNFSSGEFCHNCKRPRYRSGGSPRRVLPCPPTSAYSSNPRRFPGPSLDLSPSWTINGYRSPPQGWARMDPEILGLVAHLPCKGPGSLTMKCREIDLIA